MSIQVVQWVPKNHTQVFHTSSEYEGSVSTQDAVAIQIQSQLRIGSSDLGVNPERVAHFYKCLSHEVPNAYISNRGDMWSAK